MQATNFPGLTSFKDNPIIQNLKSVSDKHVFVDYFCIYDRTVFEANVELDAYLFDFS